MRRIQNLATIRAANYSKGFSRNNGWGGLGAMLVVLSVPWPSTVSQPTITMLSRPNPIYLLIILFATLWRIR
jgi:hypothetical protein